MSTVECVNENNITNPLECLKNCSSKLKEKITRIIANNGYQKYKLEFRNVNTNGGNFLGRLYEVSIKGSVDNEEKETNLFIKENMIIDSIELFSMKELCINEAFMYMNYADVVNNLQDEVGIPEYDKYKFAKAYEGTDDENIILENLSCKGFKTYYRMDVVSIEYAKLAVEQLAKFHALSFAVESKMPEYFKDHIHLRKAALRFGDDWEAFMTKICFKTADMFIGDDKDKILNFAKVFINNFPKHYGARDDVKCCLIHGDYRLNNVLVREIDGSPEEVVPIDFQFIVYGNPLIDFIYFIFLATDREFRKKHLSDLKLLYYSTLARFLTYFDLDIKNIYPEEVFEKIYKESLDFGLMIGIYSSVFVFIPDNTDLGLQKNKVSDLFVNPHESFKERVKGMIDDFTEWGYL